MPRTTATAVFDKTNESRGDLFWSTLVVFRTPGLAVKAGLKITVTLTGIVDHQTRTQQLTGVVQPLNPGVNPADAAGLTYVLLTQPSVFDPNPKTFAGKAPKVLTDEVAGYLDDLRLPPGDGDGGDDGSGRKHWWCYICPGPDCG